MISNFNWDCPKCSSEEGKDQVIEFYDMWDPIKFNTEIYTYFCRKCGWAIKKIVDLSTKDEEYKEINFKECKYAESPVR
jgi:uncharacterized Zn finger protein